MLIPLGTGIARVSSVGRGRVVEVVEGEGMFSSEQGVTVSIRGLLGRLP
jgi:hypothetical protein